MELEFAPADREGYCRRNDRVWGGSDGGVSFVIVIEQDQDHPCHVGGRDETEYCQNEHVKHVIFDRKSK